MRCSWDAMRCDKKVIHGWSWDGDGWYMEMNMPDGEIWDEDGWYMEMDDTWCHDDGWLRWERYPILMDGRANMPNRCSNMICRAYWSQLNTIMERRGRIGCCTDPIMTEKVPYWLNIDARRMIMGHSGVMRMPWEYQMDEYKVILWQIVPYWDEYYSIWTSLSEYWGIMAQYEGI